jgi:hypothetical protein
VNRATQKKKAELKYTSKEEDGDSFREAHQVTKNKKEKLQKSPAVESFDLFDANLETNKWSFTYGLGGKCELLVKITE